MLSYLHHRGPDGRGRFESGPFRCGMTRLAILDRENGQQPFTSSDGRIQAICNGELYNWQELRAELEKAGHQFKTRCDAEILPAAWLEWGTALPEKLNGMFALAIHDAEIDSLFLARDRCGQKPLYYTSGSSFTFASEIKALSAAGVPLRPDPSHLSTWLSLRYLPEPFTLFENIQTLPAAHWMTVSASGKTHLERYWQPTPKSPSNTEAPLDTLDQLTRSSVELALQSDVPIAAYLSGGVDSALLAHYIKDLGADITTVSIGFGAASDETATAQTTADHLDLPHHSTQLTPQSLSDLPRIIQQMDRPIGDALILAFDHLAQHTSSLGCKVALGGEGPDEHFAGYSFQRAFLTAHKLGPLGRTLAATVIDHLPPSLLDRFANFPASLGAEGRCKTANYLRQFSSRSFFRQATGLHTLFEPHEIQSLLHPDLLATQQEHPIVHSATSNSPFALNQLLATQYTHWLPDWSLIRQDKNAMAHSLEYRAPFLDHRIIDFAFTLPDSAKLTRKNDKAIWRQLAARHLPTSITQRPKQPFYLPLEHPDWRTPLITLARDILSEENWLQSETISTLFQATDFLSLKKLAALTILQLWKDQED